MERFPLRKVHTFGHAYELLLTFGVFLAIGEIVKRGLTISDKMGSLLVHFIS